MVGDPQILNDMSKPRPIPSPTRNQNHIYTAYIQNENWENSTPDTKLTNIATAFEKLLLHCLFAFKFIMSKYSNIRNLRCFLFFLFETFPESKCQNLPLNSFTQLPLKSILEIFELSEQVVVLVATEMSEASSPSKLMTSISWNQILSFTVRKHTSP